MPYCAPSVKGTQCHTCSREPFARGSRLPAQPGISSLVRRGARRGLFKRYLTLFIVSPSTNFVRNSNRQTVSRFHLQRRHCVLTARDISGSRLLPAGPL